MNKIFGHDLNFGRYESSWLKLTRLIWFALDMFDKQRHYPLGQEQIRIAIHTKNLVQLYWKSRHLNHV